ncbi:MAG: nucleotide sugar dehydrogenase [Treponema sp.]|jgi:UDP-N-acetyl-D-mannosaminuronic acid dehydrogenase|nr:nucleotide sugar dehydrogenase [Treponema sp.]
MTKKNVAIVGFGYIGSVIGSVLADRGHRVLGIEKDPRILNAVQNNQSPFNEPGLEELILRVRSRGLLELSNDVSRAAEAEVFVITVGTPLSDNYEPDLRQIKAAAESIKPYVKTGSLVMLKSTVPPGTTSDVVGPILQNRHIRLAFCPERLAEGRAIQEFLSIPVVVGGIDNESTAAAAEFWKESLGVDVITVGNARSAEMVKLADNLWIDLNIALAGELAKLADKMNIDVLDVIKAANSLPKGSHNVNILIPSVGVGGYCLTKDPWFVQHMGRGLGLELKIPRTSREVNDSMPAYSAAQIDAVLSSGEGNRGQKKIAVLGIAFKNNTGDCRFTPAKPVIDELRRLGYNLAVCDPWTGDHDARLVTDLPVSADIEKTLEGADCAAFLAGHRNFHEIEITKLAELVKPGALIFDGRMFFDKDKIEQMRAAKLRYKGVGR